MRTMSEHAKLNAWVNEVATMTEPDSIRWCDGSAEEYAEIMDNLNLAQPRMIDVAVPANLHCGLNVLQ